MPDTLLSGCCLAVLFSDFSVAVGLVGAGIGAFVGLKFIAYDRNLPLVFAIGFFALFLWLAKLILSLVYLALAAGLLVAVILYRVRISEWMTIFAQNAGLRLNFQRLKTFTDRIGEITDEYLLRRKQIGSLPLERDEIEDLLHQTETDYTDAVKGLSNEFPYLDSDARGRRRGAHRPAARDDDSMFGNWLNGA